MKGIRGITAVCFLALGWCAEVPAQDTCRLVYGGSEKTFGDGTPNSVQGVLNKHAQSVQCREGPTLEYEDPEYPNPPGPNIVRAFSCTALGGGLVYEILINDLAAVSGPTGGLIFRGRTRGHDEIPCEGAPSPSEAAREGTNPVVDPCCPYAAPSVRWFFKPSTCSPTGEARCSGSSRNWCENAATGGNYDPGTGMCRRPQFN